MDELNIPAFLSAPNNDSGLENIDNNKSPKESLLDRAIVYIGVLAISTIIAASLYYSGKREGYKAGIRSGITAGQNMVFDSVPLAREEFEDKCERERSVIQDVLEEKLSEEFIEKCGR